METNSSSEYLAIFLVVGDSRFGKLSWTMKIAAGRARRGRLFFVKYVVTQKN